MHDARFLLPKMMLICSHKGNTSYCVRDGGLDRTLGAVS